jgi:hypothetical protein
MFQAGTSSTEALAAGARAILERGEKAGVK